MIDLSFPEKEMENGAKKYSSSRFAHFQGGFEELDASAE